MSVSSEKAMGVLTIVSACLDESAGVSPLFSIINAKEEMSSGHSSQVC